METALEGDDAKWADELLRRVDQERRVLGVACVRIELGPDQLAFVGPRVYDDDRGANYAQARYLCYYLQQRGLLVKFYREFHAHQKEAAELLLEPMVAVTHRGMRELRDEGLRIAHQHLAEGRIGVELRFQHARPHPVSVTRVSHHRPVRRGPSAHEGGDADHAVDAGHRDFHGRSILELMAQGDDAIGGKVHEVRIA